ncbi:MAG: PEP-utilizing enzyme [Alphaproteobacteria bacterium]
MSHDAPPLSFATKAETLERVASRLTVGRVLPFVHFSCGEWADRREEMLAGILGLPWGGGVLIVRSSAIGEDGPDSTQAGRFLSLGDIQGEAALALAIDQVIAAYADRGAAASIGHRVLIQPMLRDVVWSGVLFTVDPATGAPYMVINASGDGDTAAVTSGRGATLDTHYVWKYGDSSALPPRQAAVIALARECEALFGADALDIEFGFVGADPRPVLFQVRPLARAGRPEVDAETHRRLLANIATRIEQAGRRHPYLCGERTVFGVMPDWNPAEIIGIRPRPLALSLYRNLVTESIWAYQRHNYGYRNLRSFPLMVDFLGLPYIDVRVSFNSFVPAEVDEPLAERLVNHYIDSLIAAPSLHDKVEFEIVLSCYTFDLPERLKRLERAGFAAAETEGLAGCLRRLTNRIINRDTGLWRIDLGRVEELEERRRAILDADLDTVSKIYWLLENCKRYGTLPFAGLARAGFIAVQMLRSLVAVGVLSQREVDAFMAGLDTVSAAMGRDLRRLDRASFLERYGHLRPGTYDILSPRYDEAPDRYFDWGAVARRPESAGHEPFALSLPQMRDITELLDRHGLEHDIVGLFDFLEAAIRGRESAKFIFSRSLSDALTLLRRLGAEVGLSAEDMSFADIAAVYELYSGSSAPGEVLRDAIARGRARFRDAQRVVLPPLIVSAGQTWAFRQPPTEPNFITHGSVIGPVRTPDHDGDMTGAIIMIPSADPGFDWVFSRGIAGFITAYGGVNSHMAIRASELGLPAVIGAGEALFARWSAAQMIELDCSNHVVRMLR